MSHTVIATSRILLNYNWGAGPHKFHAYVKNAQTGGASYLVNSRTTDANDTAWEDVATRLWASLRNLMSGSAAAAGAELQLRSGTIWRTVAASAVTSAGAGGTRFPASQVTMTLRDVLFNKIRVIMLDTVEAPPQEFFNPTGGDSAMDSFTAGWVSGVSNPADPFNCVVSKYNSYLNTAPFIAISVWLNRKAAAAAGV